MKSSKKRSRAVVTAVACILAVCLVAALVLFSLVNSKVRALQKGAGSLSGICGADDGCTGIYGK